MPYTENYKAGPKKALKSVKTERFKSMNKYIKLQTNLQTFLQKYCQSE